MVRAGWRAAEVDRGAGRKEVAGAEAEGLMAIRRKGRETRLEKNDDFLRVNLGVKGLRLSHCLV